MNDELRDQSLAGLIAGLATSVPELLEREVRLARAEAAAILNLLLSAIRKLALVSVLAAGAIAILLLALVSGITAIFVNFGMELALAGCVAAAMVALVAGLTAWLLLENAIRTMRAARDTLESSVDTLAFRERPHTEKS